MVGGGVRSVYAQKYVLGAYFLTVHCLEERLLAGVVFAYREVSYLLFTPDLMFWVHFWLCCGCGRFLGFFLFVFRLEFFANFSLNFRVRFSNLFFVLIASDLPRVEHTALIGILNNLRIFLFSSDEFFECHHGVEIKSAHVSYLL